jgi:DegV family protein with EDD domain
VELKILTDSSCDLPLKYVEENAHILQLIGMPIHIDNEEYIDDLGKTLTHDFFYKKLSEGVFPTTSQINLLVFLEHYKKCYEKGEALIYLGLSSGLSGTMNNAVLAKNMFLEEHDDADITIVDTIAASGGLGALVAHVVELAKEGKSKGEILTWIDDHILKINHWFAIDDLEHLKNGGRIPAAIALVGTALKVKPILTIAHNGKIKSYASVRGRHKSIKYLYDKFTENIEEVEHKHVFICHAHCIEDAQKLEELILKEYKPKELYITELSATIGTHVGLGMLAVAFVGKNIREDK